MVRDFSSVSMNLNSINAYLKDNGVEMSAEDSAKLNSIFKESDTQNAEGEKKPDGELSNKERAKFLKKVKSALPKLFQKLVDFATIMDVKEDLEAQRKETLERLENEQKEKQKNDINFGLD